MAYSQPTDLADALSILESDAPQIIAGGTDVYPSMQPGPGPQAFLDVTRVSSLSGISQIDGMIRIGGTATWSQIQQAPLPPAFDGLKQAAREVGSLQIQNAGTVAGNLCNASPAADGVPPLLVLGAEVELASAAQGTRRLPLEAFLTGVRATARHPNELVTAILVPQGPKGMVSAFEKLGSRRYLVISIAMTAVCLAVDAAGRIKEARVAVGACSAVAQRLPALEADLIGQDPLEAQIRPEHLAPLTPIDDVRGTGAYRLDAVKSQIRQTIAKAART